jgi:hypothetical protein
MSSTLTRLTALAAGAILLAGCASPAPAPVETSDPGVLAEDCAALTETVSASVLTMAGTTAEQIKADPQGAIDLLEDAVDAIDSAAQKVRDAELRSAAEGTVTVMRDYVATLRGAAGDPDNVDKTLVTAQATLVQEQLKKVAALCA